MIAAHPARCWVWRDNYDERPFWLIVAGQLSLDNAIADAKARYHLSLQANRTLIKRRRSVPWF